VYLIKFLNEWGANFIPKPGHYLDTLTLEDIPAGRYVLQWFDPASGALKDSEQRNWQGGDLKLFTPSYQLDLALLIRNKR
jgi:hypothetical protein